MPAPISPTIIQARLRTGRAWTPSEIAAVLKVDPKTVTRWCKAGRVQHFYTPGGHHRIPAAEVRKLLGLEPS